MTNLSFLTENGTIFLEHIRRFGDLPFQFGALVHTKRMSILSACPSNYRLEHPEQDLAARDAKLFVHFSIFDWIEQHVAGWSDVKLEYALITTHFNAQL
ncbi:hypothetical protein [Acidocella aminolytica]|uniref:Uncharacterized protein n=1 Tax=Acidocella aminolytica 101 = DSM 11237 TaxID=1120923 RepID=A0A0D6PK98_9PROT|nr:hypothetical protein [Acidocella aminolytica]GAN81851.1 hypothetical protein Aam_123_017 [Acidocella aminolytica 101 = DSM 11237]GBQ42861.1 hypothetical protein AA11237_3093 [Acidocella aminolytica 101 = DSM 11237]